MTINHLPDEVILEIFDSYRRSIDPLYDNYYDCWRKRCVWFKLTHVCRKWRAIMFASTSRLDLGITVGPKKPDHIKTIPSEPFPIFVRYYDCGRDMTSSALWQLRAALKQQDRVREIYFEGPSDWFDELFRNTNCSFPILESPSFETKFLEDVKIPDTFLGGSYLHLRHLKLERIFLTSISRFLLSTSALTDLSLRTDTAFGASPETSLLTCLQGMPCLCRLSLSMADSPLEIPSQHSTLKDIVTLSKLTSFHYAGHGVFFDAIVAGLSAPSLRDLNMQFCIEIMSLTVHPLRFINET
jgi:F-box-like